MNDHYTPENRIEFYDHNSNRQMMLADFHSGGLWLFYKHPDGQWVSLAKPAFEDIKRIMDIRVKESQGDSRAAGFAEGIEAAAKIVTEERREYGKKLEKAMGEEPYHEPRGTVHMWTSYYRCAREIKDKIRALLPKKKTAESEA